MKYANPISTFDRWCANKKNNLPLPKSKGETKTGASSKSLKRKVDSEIVPNYDPNKAIFFFYEENGHWRCSCRKYLKDVKKNKAKGIGTSGIFIIELPLLQKYSLMTRIACCKMHR